MANHGAVADEEVRKKVKEKQRICGKLQVMYQTV